MSNKFKRITDLFSQGDMCYLGDDEEGKPICVWVMKNTSIEEDEARMDGQSARTQYLLATNDLMHPEVQNIYLIVGKWTEEELQTAVGNQNYEKCMSLALADIDGDKEWDERMDYLRRQSELMDDADIKEDDPRRVQWETFNVEYLKAVSEKTDERVAAIKAEAAAKPREEVEQQFVDEYKDRQALEHYMADSRITKLYYATRDCEAEKLESGLWSHKGCNHGQRLMASRKEVRELPEEVLAKIIATFDAIQVGSRNVANFPEAQSSSESSA